MITFDRSLGITKNSVVLPLGYELIAVNYPSQIRIEDDGRIAVSFIKYWDGGGTICREGAEGSAMKASPSRWRSLCQPGYARGKR